MLKKLLKICFLPYYNSYLNFREAKMGYSYLKYLKFKILGSEIYFGLEENCTILLPRNIYVGKNSPIGRSGCYINGAGKIFIGDYVQFGPNVGIISANHDIYDQTVSNESTINIGNYCWIGMNSVVTAGVTLGPRTIVGACSVVTKSFPDGYCVIAGTPAKVIKHLDKDKFIPQKFNKEYYGFLTPTEFHKKRKKYLDI